MSKTLLRSREQLEKIYHQNRIGKPLFKSFKTKKGVMLFSEEPLDAKACKALGDHYDKYMVPHLQTIQKLKKDFTKISNVKNTVKKNNKNKK